MVRLLSRSGLEAHWVQSGASALAWIEKNRVDLVLLDADITGPDALDVLRSLRMRCDPVRLPVVLIAGRSGGCDSGEALDCGANDYITRPVDFAIAQARIRTLLSRKRAEEALRKSEQRYALAAQAANDGLWDWDFITNKIYYSPRWKSMLGWKEDEIGDTVDEWFRRIHPDDAPRVRSDIAAHLAMLHEVRRRASEFDLIHFHGVDVASYPLDAPWLRAVPKLITLHLPLDWYAPELFQNADHLGFNTVSEWQHRRVPRLRGTESRRHISGRRAPASDARRRTRP